jgi:hypothetical protein
MPYTNTKVNIPNDADCERIVFLVRAALIQYGHIRLVPGFMKESKGCDRKQLMDVVEEYVTVE